MNGYVISLTVSRAPIHVLKNYGIMLMFYFFTKFVRTGVENTLKL